MAFQNVTIAGTGVLGSQIAYQTALNGFKVTAYDLDVDAAKQRVLALKDSYKRDLDLFKMTTASAPFVYTFPQ